MESNIEKWNTLTNEIVENWIREVFEIDNNNDEEEKLDYFWVDNSIGTIFYYGDYYINFSDVLLYYKKNARKELFFMWYAYNLEASSQELDYVDFRRYISVAGKSEISKEYLQEVKNRVSKGKETSKTLLENYGK